MINLKNKRILICGGNGLLGKALQKKLLEKGITNFIAPSSKTYNYLNRPDVINMFDKQKPEIVFNLFVSFGGIIANENHPAKIFEDNLIGNYNLIRVAKDFGKLEKFIQIGSQCSYGDNLEPPFKEEDIWNGLPTENNAPYGISKRAILMMLQSYRKEYNFPGIYLIPSNLFGPEDNFHPTATHVIPSLIRRFVEAKEQNKEEVIVWGNGQSTREFLYNEDCAEALILAAEKYDNIRPLNIGTGHEISIKDLANLIKDIVEYGGKIVFNNNGLDGQKRRCNNINRFKYELDFVANTPLLQGIIKTVEYFYKNRNKLRESKIYE